jgi:hypothetical protein
MKLLLVVAVLVGLVVVGLARSGGWLNPTRTCTTTVSTTPTGGLIAVKSTSTVCKEVRHFP